MVNVYQKGSRFIAVSILLILDKVYLGKKSRKGAKRLKLVKTAICEKLICILQLSLFFAFLLLFGGFFKNKSYL